MPTVVFISNIFVRSFGPRGGEGIMVRSGRAFGKYFLKEYCEVLGFDTHPSSIYFPENNASR